MSCPPRQCTKVYIWGVIIIAIILGINALGQIEIGKPMGKIIPKGPESEIEHEP